MTTTHLARRLSRYLPLAVVPILLGGMVSAAPASAKPAPLLAQFSATVSSADTTAVPPAVAKGGALTLAFRITNLSNYRTPIGRVSVTAPAGFALATPAVNLPGWAASISGQKISANIARPISTAGIVPGQSVTVSVRATNNLVVSDPTTTTWPVTATGPLGLIVYKLQGNAPTVVALPVGAAAFGAAPNTPLTGIAAPAATGTLCALNPTNPVCSTADLSKGANGNVYFGQTSCPTSDPTCPLGTEVDLTADFGQLYSATAPGSVVISCLVAACPHRATGEPNTENEPSSNYDYNFLCPGNSCSEGGDPYVEREVNEDFANYPVYVQLKGATSFSRAPRCVPESDLTTTGIVTDPAALAAGFCVDVNAITRTGNTFNGDLVRPVLFIEDVKMR